LKGAGLPEGELISPGLLLNAYRSGIFPMADGREGEIRWYMPLQRAVFPLEAVKISRSLRRTMNKNVFSVRIDTAFEEVMRGCARRDETWISEAIVQSYIQLFHLRFAHSVESWHEGKLVGGLYGVALGGAFFGESMFSTMTDASKVAFAHLVRRLREREFSLLDAQFMTPHLARLGAVEISKEEYATRLQHALLQNRVF
jgi:leucyl/phenylalanyl-tRNA---protein transferase